MDSVFIPSETRALLSNLDERLALIGPASDPGGSAGAGGFAGPGPGCGLGGIARVSAELGLAEFLVGPKEQ